MNPDERVGLVLAGRGAWAVHEAGVMKAIYGAGGPAARRPNSREAFRGAGAGAFSEAVAASGLPGRRPSPIGTPVACRGVAVYRYGPRRVPGGKSGFLDFSRGNIETAIADGARDPGEHNCAGSGWIEYNSSGGWWAPSLVP